MTLPDGFPSTAGAARDAAILVAARAGQLTYELATVVVGYGEHSGSFQVFRDGLKLGGVRLAASAMVSQQVADILGFCLATPRLLDESFLQATAQIPPAIISPVSSSTDAMVHHSEMIDAAAGGSTGLVMPIGKPWVLSKLATTANAALYGWQSNVPIAGVTLRSSTATPGVKVVQPLSTAHALDYVDYSSSIWLVSRKCTVDGVERDLYDILKDATLAPLVSHEEALVNVRQPGVPLGITA